MVFLNLNSRLGKYNFWHCVSFLIKMIRWIFINHFYLLESKAHRTTDSFIYKKHNKHVSCWICRFHRDHYCLIKCEFKFRWQFNSVACQNNGKHSTKCWERCWNCGPKLSVGLKRFATKLFLELFQKNLLNLFWYSFRQVWINDYNWLY